LFFALCLSKVFKYNIIDSNESESENCQLDEDARSVEKDQENNKIQDFGEESGES
jgi:hypothetical protein